jgi:putative acetyltransferase
LHIINPWPICLGRFVFEIVEDDLSGEGTIALLRIHLAGMRANSPPGSVFALDLSGLKVPEVTVWTVRQGDQVISIGALKTLDSGSGELKSMRTHPDHLRQGTAALLLGHMIATARRRGWKKLSLETGSGPAFEPALNLYRNRGFVEGPAFSDYEPSPFNQFLHLAL